MRCAEFGSVRDRGGGTSSPSPPASPPAAISTRSTVWGDPGEEPDTVSCRLYPGYGCSPDIAALPLPPSGGGGGAPQARAGWGLPAEVCGIPRRNAGGEDR